MLQIKDFRETRVYQEALEEGIEKGIEQGRKEGLERGIERGMEQGRQGERELFAVRLLAKKMPLADVAELSGLPLRRVRQLKKGMEGNS